MRQEAQNHVSVDPQGLIIANAHEGWANIEQPSKE